MDIVETIMSMEICVLSDVRISSIAEWQNAVGAEELPLQLPPGEPLSASGGGDFVALLRAKRTRIEYSIVDFDELIGTYKTVEFGRRWKYVLAFIWSSDFAEEIAAWMAATAYARATHGVVFDEHNGQLLTAAEALKVALELERLLPEKEAAFQIFLQQLHGKS